jgi:hypothetical protein
MTSSSPVGNMPVVQFSVFVHTPSPEALSYVRVAAPYAGIKEVRMRLKKNSDTVNIEIYFCNILREGTRGITYINKISSSLYKKENSKIVPPSD